MKGQHSASEYLVNYSIIGNHNSFMFHLKLEVGGKYKVLEYNIQRNL